MKYLIILLVLVQNFVFGQNLIGCKVMPSNSTTSSTSVKRSSNTLMDNYDVKYYNIDLNVSNTSLAIKGFVQMKAQAKKDGFNQVVLNLANTFTVDSVYINGKKVTYSKSGDELTIQATTNFIKNQYFESIVYYRGDGSAGTDFPAGMNLGTQGNNSYLYTVSEPYHSYLWWPCKQDLLDKADSAAINITTKGTNLVASNGLLQKTTSIGTDKRFEWKTRYPIAYYLLTFSAGPYVEYKTYANPAGFSKPILIQAFLYDQAYLTSNKAVIDQTALLIEKFSEKFGLYPFAEEKYGYYTAPFKYGALENQTMTMMNGFNFDLVAHELSHQWFGNNVTCTDWSQIWLHEGIADFCESVANEIVYGESSRQSSISYSQTKVLETPLNCATIKETHIPLNIFNKVNAYSKGATVMNMLRFEIGEDTTFFGMLKAYQKKYAGRNANTDSLSLFIKGYTGKDFSTFFNQWIVGTGFPSYKFYNAYQRGDTLYISNTQSTSSSLTPFYAMKLDFNLVNSSGGVNYVTAYQNKSNETFKFLVKNQRITSVKPNPKLWSLYTNHSGSSISVLSGDNFITAFNIPGAISSSISGTIVEVLMPKGTDVKSLTPTFSVSTNATVKIGSAIQTSGTSVNDFSQSVVYTVTAQNGMIQTYTVNVKLKLSPYTEKNIQEFSFKGLSPIVKASISGTSITAIVPNATNLKTLIATFTASLGSSVRVGNVIQTSGATTNDYTNPLTYVVIAEDGSAQNYTVTITLARPDAPLASSPSAVCEGNTIPNLVAKGTGIRWYSDAGLTNVVGKDTSLYTGKTTAGIYSYYVTQTANGLESLPTLVTLTIHGIPASPVSGGDQITTEGSTIPNLTVSSPTEVSWYSDTLLADFLDTGSTYSTGKTLTGTYTFYATARVNGCTSIATAVKLTINTPPAAWTVVTSNATSANLYGVAAPSKTSNWAIGAGGVLVSNTGTTWSTVTSGLTSDINAVSFNGTNNGWAVGKSGKILQYDGTKWAAATNSSFISLHSVCAVDATTAFAAGASGRLLKYTGGSWNKVTNSAVSDSLFAMSFAGTSKGIIVGGSGTIMTFNGTAWSSTTQGTSSLYGVHLLDANTGWAVGAKGTILKYNGTSWTSFTSGVSTTLRSVYFTSPSNGYAVGNGGVILKYDGTSWTKVASGTTNNLYGVAFSDANTGWAVGAAGTIVAFQGVTNTVALPTVTPQSVCLGETTPALNAEGSNVVWYSDAAATVQVGTGNSFTPSLSAVGIYTFYVTQTVNSVKSLPVAVTLSIKTKPSAPTTSGNITIAQGATLTPYTATGSNLVWYSDANLTNQIATGSSFTPTNPSLGTTTYYVIQSVNACTSPTASVTLTITNSKSNLKAITAFSFNGFTPDITGTISGTKITATVPYGTDVMKLVASFTASPKATVSIGSIPQTSGSTGNDFSKSVTYTVTAEDGTTQDYVVIVTVGTAPKSSEKAITSFGFIGFNPTILATIKDTTITATVPAGTDVTKLVVQFTVSPKATVRVGSVPQTSGSNGNDFSKSVTYTVTAEDGTTQDYVVIVTVGTAPKSSEKAITSFGFTGFTTSNIIATIKDTTITATVPVGTDVTKLRAIFTVSAKATVSIGSTAQTSGSSINDFKTSVTYTVTAEDGTTQDYVVIVTVGSAPKSSEKAITAFGFTGFTTPNITATIKDTTITAMVPVGTDVTKLRATFTASAKATVSIGSTPQTSGSNINDFTSSVTYTVTAEDGTTQDYVVIVTVGTVPKSSEKAITAFGFTGFSTTNIIATIKDTTITATVPYGTDVTKLRATFTASEKATVSIGSIPQTSGSNIHDFTSSVTYTVTAEDGTTQDYVVIVKVDPGTISKSTEKNIVSFTFVSPASTGFINGENISVTLPYGTDLTNLVASFTLSDKATAQVNGVLQVSGVTKINFSTPVIYTITAEDGSVKSYTVFVSLAKNSAKELTTYLFTNPVASGVFNGNTISLQVPFGTDVTKLVSSFTVSSGALVKVKGMNQISGVTANDFTSPVTYTVFAEDGTTQDYMVVVYVLAAPKSSEKDILTFGITNPYVTGLITGNEIAILLPYGTDVTSLTAFFTLSPKSTAYIGTFAQMTGLNINNFSSPVSYTVTAEDGTTKTYVVTVTIDKNPLGIENLEKATFTVFPNPSSGNFYVEAESGTLALRVTDLQGRVVYQLENNSYTGAKLHVDLSPFGASTYLMHLTNNGRDQLRKIEVVR